MSASLVGSEMCIRDSLLASAGAAHVAMGGPRRFPQLPAVSNACPRPGGCLLYTSDAADDM
eukprot:1600972-Alexandrium_andersonii.AAC.1